MSFVILLVLFVNCYANYAPPYYTLSLAMDSYELPELAYSKSELEPYISSHTYMAHYCGHHLAYRVKMNAFKRRWGLEYPTSEFAKSSILMQMKNLDKIPEQYLADFTKNAGGFINHAIYWACISPNEEDKPREPTGDLENEIYLSFGGFDNFKEKFTAEAMALFGSGYVWLVREAGKLQIVTTANQGCPLSAGQTPLLTIDLWEHAYYLDVNSARARHINSWWMLVDWQNVADMDYFWLTGELAARWRPPKVAPRPGSDKCIDFKVGKLPTPASKPAVDAPAAAAPVEAGAAGKMADETAREDAADVTPPTEEKEEL